MDIDDVISGAIFRDYTARMLEEVDRQLISGDGMTAVDQRIDRLEAILGHAPPRPPVRPAVPIVEPAKPRKYDL